MSLEELQNLAAQWIAYQHSWDVNQFSPETLSLEWASDSADELLSGNPDDAWKLILIIHGLDQSDPTSQFLSAHSFEDFMELNGPAFIDRVEAEVEKNQSFGRIVSGIYKAKIRDEVWERLTVIRERYMEMLVSQRRSKRRLLRSVSRRRNRRTL